MKTALPLRAALVVCAALASASGTLAAEPKLITYQSSVQTAATLKLLRGDGKVGRDTPFYSNYRPQVWFSGEKDGVTCAVRLLPPREKVEPGETAEVLLGCLEPFRVKEGQLQFKVTEGGRVVAEGSLK